MSSQTRTWSTTVPGAWEDESVSPDQSSTLATYSGGRLATTTARDSNDATLESASYSYDVRGRTQTVTHSRTEAVTTAYKDNGGIGGHQELMPGGVRLPPPRPPA